jgi:hypothetical protein
MTAVQQKTGVLAIHDLHASIEGTGYDWIISELGEDAASPDGAASEPSPTERAFADQHQFEAAREG